MKMNQKNSEIIVSALFGSKTFANRNELKRCADEIEATRRGVYDTLEFAIIQEHRAPKSSAAQQVVSSAAEATRPDPELAGAGRELGVAEEKWTEAQQVWLSRARELENELPGRLRNARGNATSLSRSRVGNWVNQGQGEVGRLRRVTEIAERKLKRVRVKYNKLKFAADQLRRERDVRISVPDHPDSPLTLQEFTDLER
jgi:hypothetical protein